MKRLSIIAIGCFTGLVFLNASGCKNKNTSTAESTAPAVEEKPVVVEQKPAEEPAKTVDYSKILPDLAKVKISTKFGDMVVALYNETPQHRDNFLKLAGEKFYDGLLFHRCINQFMIQGGDPQSKGAGPSAMLGNGGPGYTIPAEFNAKLIHKKGALCAARQGDQVNPKKASSGSQFYIVQGQVWTDMQLSQIEMNIGASMPGFKYTDEQKTLYKTIGGTAQLDMNYTVYGEVIDGLNVVDAIAALPGNQMNRPANDVVMSMEVIQKEHK
jgi:cyclophilin family peptidyl-prolyl cis-trans isomerase